jgi:hypothetical protein
MPAPGADPTRVDGPASAMVTVNGAGALPWTFRCTPSTGVSSTSDGWLPATTSSIPGSP